MRYHFYPSFYGLEPTIVRESTDSCPQGLLQMLTFSSLMGHEEENRAYFREEGALMGASTFIITTINHLFVNN